MRSFQILCLVMGLLGSAHAHATLSTVVKCEGPRIENDFGTGYLNISYDLVFNLDLYDPEIVGSVFGGAGPSFKQKNNVETLRTFLTTPTIESLSLSEISDSSEMRIFNVFYIDRTRKVLKTMVSWDAGWGSGGINYNGLEIQGSEGYFYSNRPALDTPEALAFGKVLPLRNCNWNP